MKVIKRNGVEVDFTPEKIKNAIVSANEEVNVMDQLTGREIEKIVIGLTNTFKFMNRSVSLLVSIFVIVMIAKKLVKVIRQMIRS